MAQMAQQFTVEEFLKKVPERGPKGAEIPMWKRQMMAKKAAEKAKKEAEEEIRRQVEEKIARSVPSWKKQLKKDNGSNVLTPIYSVPVSGNIR